MSSLRVTIIGREISPNIERGLAFGSDVLHCLTVLDLMFLWMYGSVRINETEVPLSTKVGVGVELELVELLSEVIEYDILTIVSLGI